MAQRGAFIVVEGLDCSGKTAQTSILRDRLEKAGHRIALIKFPDRTTPIGKMIDSYLRSESELDDQAIHLLFSANRWELCSTIQSHLSSNTIIIYDRYAFSGIAFSAAKGLWYKWCRSPDIGLPSPDLTIFLDISPEKARERGSYGEERYEKEEMQRKVCEIFQKLGSETRNWTVVDAGNDLHAVSDNIWEAVGPLLGGIETGFGRLWTERR